MLQQFLELNNFGHLKLIATYNGRKVTSFSNHLSYDWRRMVKLSEGYGSIEDELLEILEDEPEWSVVFRLGRQEIPLTWSNKKIGQASIQVDQDEKTISVKKIVTIDGKPQENIVVVGHQLIACLDSGELIKLDAKGAWDFCDFCLQLEDNMSDDFTVIESQRFSCPTQFYYHFDHPLAQFDQGLSATVPIDLFKQVQWVASEQSQFPFNEQHVESQLEVHLVPEPEFQSYVLILANNVNGTLYRPSVRTFVEVFNSKKYASQFFGYDVEKIATDQLVFSDKSWHRFTLDEQKEQLVLTTFSDVFKGKATVLPNELCVRVSQQDVHLLMPDILKRLEDAQVPFFMQEKPLYLKQVSVSVDIDDDLAPSVSISNEQFSSSFWLNIQEHMDLFESENSVYFLDKETRLAIQQISKLYKQDQQSTSEKNPDNQPNFRMLDWFNLQSLGVEINTSSTLMDTYKKVQNFSELPILPLPKNKRLNVRDYQRLGFSWVAFLHNLGFGACLADDMGLGKTIQVLTFVLAMKQGIVTPKSDTPKHLIVVPPSLLFNWESEVNRLFPELKVSSYFGQHRKLVLDDCDIVLTTYDTLRIDAETLAEVKFESIVFDEAQFTKNLMSKRAQAVRKLNGHFTLCLTGTPLENSIYEYYAIIDLAIPGIFGTLEDFQKQMSDFKNTAILNRAKPFVLRRTKDEILKELPKKSESDLWLNMNDSQKSLYTKIIQASRNEIETGNPDTMSILTGILRLRQICAAPEILSMAIKGDHEKHQSIAELIKDVSAIHQSPKVEFLVNKIRELHLEGHSVLVYSQFRSMLDILQPKLVEQDLACFRLDGSTPVNKRKKDVQAFQELKDPATYLISLKAGGVGLNLTKASVVFFVEPWWNPAVENQAADRTHRIGQQKPVFVYRLLMANSIEEKMMELKDKKQDLFKKILTFSLNDSVDYKLKKDDLLFLLSS